jgi:hypothetical protein
MSALVPFFKDKYLSRAWERRQVVNEKTLSENKLDFC